MALLGAPASASDTRPNIVLLVVDDLRNDDLAHLPRLQNLLVDRGTTFERYFTPNALCCPSRTSMLRGQFSHNHQVWTNFAGLSGGFATVYERGLEQDTVAIWLRAAGYETALIGKYLNGYGSEELRRPGQDYVPPGWSEWFAILDPKGDMMYDGYDYTMNDNGTLRAYGSAPADFNTDVFAARARLVVERRAGLPRQPLFLYLAPTAAHRPNPIAPRHQPNPYAAFEPVFPPSFNEADVSDKPAWLRAIPPLSRRQTRKMIEQVRERLGSMLAVEDLLETVMDALARAGELDNTYIFLVSDNGYHLGEHRLLAKATLYDEAVRVPLVVRGPGVPEGEARTQLSYNHDLPVTFAEIAGVPPANFVDGRSLLPLLGASPPSAWRQSVLLEHREHNAKPRSQPEANAIRTSAYQYVEYVGGTERCELYEMAPGLDPAQLRNRCDEPALAQVQAALAARLRALTTCRRQTCRDLEVQPVP